MAVYTYLDQDVNLTKLDHEISQSSFGPTKYNGATLKGDEEDNIVSIYTSSDLIAGELTELDNIFTNHVNQDISHIQAFTTSGSILSGGGKTVTWTGSAGDTLTLPDAIQGEYFEVWNIDATDVITISRGGTDTIHDNLTSGALTFKIPAGSRAEFTCLSNGQWRAVYKNTITKSGSFSVPGSIGNFSVTGLGFRPKKIDFTSSFVSSALIALIGQGSADALGNQWVASITLDGSERNTFGTGSCIYADTGAGTAYYNASYGSMDVDGFTLVFSSVNTSGRVGWTATA